MGWQVKGQRRLVSIADEGEREVVVLAELDQVAVKIHYLFFMVVEESLRNVGALS